MINISHLQSLSCLTFLSDCIEFPNQNTNSEQSEETPNSEDVIKSSVIDNNFQYDKNDSKENDSYIRDIPEILYEKHSKTY